MTDYFPKIYGQQALKNTLKFGLESFFANELLPFYLFVSPKGGGKSLSAFSLGGAIAKKYPEYKWCEINCAKFKRASDFFESDCFLNDIMGKHTVVFFDEMHNLPKDMMNIFLTMFSTDGGTNRIVPYGTSPTINLRNTIFLFATSEPDKLFPPLLDRLEKVAIAPYSKPEIQEIIRQRHKDIVYSEGLLEEISLHTRGTPRSAVQMANNIKRYCSIKKSDVFSAKDWKSFQKMTDAKIHGLDVVEINILRILQERGPCSLNELRAITGLSRTALTNNHEIKLLQNNLMKVDVKRQITHLGRKIVENFKTI